MEDMYSSMVLVVLELSHRHGWIPNARRNDVDWSLLLSDELFVSFPTSQRTSQSEFVCKSYCRRGERYAKRCFRSTNSTRTDVHELLRLHLARAQVQIHCDERWLYAYKWCPDLLINGTRRSRKCHTGPEGFQAHAEMT